MSFLLRSPRQFQFTHPGKGATRLPSLERHRVLVSIHAPWEGCDKTYPSTTLPRSSFNSRTLGRVRRTPRAGRPYTRGFNSRTLGRVRRSSSGRSSSLTGFNSRTLGRVRRGLVLSSIIGAKFQFTHPGKGATGLLVSSCHQRRSFNSRTLGRVRRPPAPSLLTR